MPSGATQNLYWDGQYWCPDYWSKKTWKRKPTKAPYPEARLTYITQYSEDFLKNNPIEENNDDEEILTF